MNRASRRGWRVLAPIAVGHTLACAVVAAGAKGAWLSLVPVLAPACAGGASAAALAQALPAAGLHLAATLGLGALLAWCVRRAQAAWPTAASDCSAAWASWLIKATKASSTR